MLERLYQQHSEKKSFIISLVVMLVLHMIFIAQKFDLASFMAHDEAQVAPQAYKVDLANLEEFRKAMTAQRQAKQQIVQTTESESKRKVDRAFLGEKDNSFDRQTVARKVDTFHNGTGAKAGAQGQAEKGSMEKAVPKKISLSDLGFGAKDLAAQQKLAQETAKDLQAGNRGPGGTGVSSTNDFVEDIPLGDFTHLNTQEFKFYGFYHRIRSKLEQFWGRNIQEQADKIFRQGRRVPASENHITSLVIKISPAGEIVHVQVKGTSGIKELDDAAVDSFNQAGPFPNPPKEMIVNGYAVIEWGFVVNT